MNRSDEFAVIITAAGRGSRAGGGLPKQWRPLLGEAVLSRTIRAFAGFSRVIVTLHPDDMPRGVSLLAGPVTLVAGGESRSDSVRAALDTLEGSQTRYVLIHDGARPLVSDAVIKGVMDALLAGAPAAAPAVPVTDTLWRGQDGKVIGFENREGLFRAQTPQGFRLVDILAAHRSFPDGATDDVGLAARAGIPVTITEGDEDNLKLTWAEDFLRATRILQGN